MEQMNDPVTGERVHQAELSITASRNEALTEQLRALENSKKELSTAQEEFKSVSRDLVSEAKRNASVWRTLGIVGWAVASVAIITVMVLLATR